MNTVAPGGARARLVVTLVSVVAILCCVVLLVLVATGSGKNDGTNLAASDSGALAADRSAAESVANTFVTALGTYDRSMLQGALMPAYRANVEAVASTKLKVDFDQNGAPRAEKAVALAGIKETTKIWYTGVAAISQDQATVIVVGSITVAIPKTAGGSDYQSAGETPFRTVVTLIRSDGRWLVDAQTPAEGVPPSTVQTSSATPSSSATPTSGASQ